MRMPEGLAIVQGAYFTLTGVWPLVHVRLFMAVTGPKTDVWLVRTVGVLVLVIGITVGLAGWRGGLKPEIVLLAVGSAVGLAGIDLIYVLRGAIARIFLADAAVELVIA